MFFFAVVFWAVVVFFAGIFFAATFFAAAFFVLSFFAAAFRVVFFAVSGFFAATASFSGFFPGVQENTATPSAGILNVTEYSLSSHSACLQVFARRLTIPCPPYSLRSLLKISLYFP